jgi:hypothetical protein
MRLRCGGLLMLGYQKSSAAAPKPRNCFELKHLTPTLHVGGTNLQTGTVR